MNNPDDFPVDEAEVREWINERRARTGLSWKALSEESGISQGTLSPWATGTYSGNGRNVAKKVFKYRQTLESQQERAAEAESAGLGNAPTYIATPTGRRLRGLLVTAHSGQMTYAATGPGTGKTVEARNYVACAANAFMVTMKPTTRTLTAMLGEVIRALGGRSGSAWARQMSAQVIEMVKGRRCLLIVDEANYLEFDALEELRAWHDIAGLGICLLGNEELHATIRGSVRTARHSFARLNRRIAMSHVQDMPQGGDIEAFLDAWGIANGEQRSLLMRVGLTAGTGGLGEINQIISNASLLALEDGQALSHAHLREAMAARATSHLRLAS